MTQEIDIIRAGLECAPSSSTNTAACAALARLSAALRSYAELTACLEWLCRYADAQVTVQEGADVESSCCPEPESVLNMARHLGWPGLEES